MKDKKTEEDILKFKSENKNDENVEESAEFMKLKKLVNTLLNDKIEKKYTIYTIEMAYTIKNEEISSNFEKLAKNEETLYGWFIFDESDEKLKQEILSRLKEKGLEKVATHLKKGKNEAWKRLEEIIDRYKPKKKKIWFMYFINGYTINEIAEKTYYEQRQLKRIIKSMREELITYLPYQDLKDNEIIEGEDKNENYLSYYSFLLQQ